MAGELRVVDLGAIGLHGVEIDGVKKGVHGGGFIRPLGDINGDGFADFNVTSGHLSGDSDFDMVFYGGSSLPGKLGPSNCDGIHGFEVSSVLPGVAAGDVNGDGVDDMVFDRGKGVSYSASVLYGDPDRHAAEVAIPTTDGADGVVFGLALCAGLGDINGDGFDDVLGLTRGLWNGYDYANSQLQVLLGGPTGSFSTLGVYSDASYAFGRTASALGDINGDGFDDFRVDGTVLFGGADISSINIDHISSAQGFYEGYSARAAGDVNRDGIGDLIVEHTVVFGHAGPWHQVGPLDVDGSNGFMITGTVVGAPPVAAAGDVNGDGFDDILVGDYLDSTNGEEAGAVYVIYGSDRGWQHAFDVSTLDDSGGFKVLGALAGDHVGRFTDYKLGDVNGDGLGDIALSAPDADVAAGPNTGAGYVIYGLLPDHVVDRVGTDGDDTLAAGNFNDRLTGLGGDDALYGNGGKDRVAGGDGDDVLHGGIGKDVLGGGIGDDTLIGGGDRDKLSGGEGADLFVFESVLESPAKAFDTISDLDASDVIDLSAIDADTKTAGDQAFHLVSHFSKHAGELVLTYVAAKDMTVLSCDVDGNGKADFAIHISGDQTGFSGLVL